MFKKHAVTIFFDTKTQKKVQDNDEPPRVVEEQHSAHWEIGFERKDDSKATIVKITECLFGGVKIYFSDGIVWKYNKNFKYITS